jgi:type I restriction enzyme, S subunit
MGWRRIPLKRLVDINRRALLETTDGDTAFRYIDISACGRGSLVADPEPMLFRDAPTRARRLVQPGDTIVSTVRTYLRAVWPVSGRADDLVVSTAFAVLSPMQDLDPRFLGWLAQSDVVIEEIVARSVGVSYPALNGLEVGDIKVPAPEIATQRAIADYLDAETNGIEALIDARAKARLALAERRRGVVDQLLLPAEGAGWRHISVKRLLRRIEQGWSPQCESRPAEVDEWGVLKAGAANGGVFRPTENKALPSDIEPLIEYEIRAGDLLVSRANTRELLASVCVVPPVRPRLLLCDKLFRLTPHPDIDTRFLAYALTTSDARRQIESEATGTSDSMQNVGQDTIRQLLIWAPRDRDQQTAIADELDRRLRRISLLDQAMEGQIGLLHERRQALITAAVSGEIDIPEVAA